MCEHIKQLAVQAIQTRAAVEKRAEAAKAKKALAAQVAKVCDGAVLQCIVERAKVYTSPTSRIRMHNNTVKKGSTLFASGQPVFANRNWMVPIEPSGAMRLKDLNF